ncbi:MAG: hypothetical protein IKU25_04895 [Clostridia bacterium]|nr:hypothetical protein [Clostridia bacterium]
MKKVFIWPIAVITSLISLITMLVFDFVLSFVWYFIGKVPFLTEIIDSIGEILDLGLTALTALVIVTSIWAFGHSIIQKIKGKSSDFQKSPVYYVNSMFFIMFLVMAIFLGYKFTMMIGEAVTVYTVGSQGVEKFLLFAKAIKDTLYFICRENIVIYRIGTNSLILSIVNVFSNKFIH